MSGLAVALMLSALSCDPTAADVGAAGGDACARAWMDQSLRMNDIAAVGTHNSYKLAIPQAELDAMLAANPVAGAMNLPGTVLTSSYQGSETLHSVVLETGQEVFIRERNQGSEPSVRPQQRVFVSIDASQTLVVPE